MKSAKMQEAPRKHTWKKIIDHPDLEIYWPSRVTVVGFLAAWASFIAAATCERVLDIPLPWQMICYLTAGITTGIVVGLLTRRQPKEHLDHFYDNLKTPLDKEEHLASDTVGF